MSVTIEQLIESFMDGDTNGITGTKSSPGDLKIIGDQLIHYMTPILERYNTDSYIFNMTQYSIQTGRVQKIIKAKIKDYIIVKKIPRDYKGKLSDYVMSK
ncbi:hypothetical protein [Kandleria vitulina]|uniref:hypothetical protein n=1 Tax=Kandleria vitulina TaxID=1630 RepID=UPI00048C8778|nr:hypothetical protein [Kandleria vitulina]